MGWRQNGRHNTATCCRWIPAPSRRRWLALLRSRRQHLLSLRRPAPFPPHHHNRRRHLQSHRLQCHHPQPRATKIHGAIRSLFPRSKLRGTPCTRLIKMCSAMNRDALTRGLLYDSAAPASTSCSTKPPRLPSRSFLPEYFFPFLLLEIPELVVERLCCGCKLRNIGLSALSYCQ